MKMGTQPVKELLLFDPRIYSDLDKYIWIGDTYEEHMEAQRFFVCLLKKGIYIKGFATDKEPMFGLEMSNKKIYDISTLDQQSSVVFHDTHVARYAAELPEGVHNARILNPDMPRENIVIWGSGITGRRVYRILTGHGIKVECCIDSNKDLEGENKWGMVVHTPEYLEKYAEPPTIIEAMEKWGELDACIRGRYGKRFYFSFVEEKKTAYNGHYITKMFNLMTWSGNFAFFVGKKVYVYGIGEVENEMAGYLKLLDISFGGFLIDESDMADDSKHGDHDVRWIEEVLYEQDYFIWVYNRSKVKRLEELGLVSHENYIYYDGINNTSIKRPQVLDTNLGHNYLFGSKYPGIMVYGADRENDYKIAVLGGSTTDGKAYSFKSWPELMYEELHDKGFQNITVYNGGISGYASGQELLKLIRDLIPLEPDMVIVYNGFNDSNYCSSYPLTGGYLKKIFEFAKENIENDEDASLFMGESHPICQGIKASEDAFSAWLSNIRTMYAVAKEWDIRFYSFCQPMLSSKEGKTEAEKSMLLSVHSPSITNLMNGSFRKRISRMDRLPGYIYDLSHIFDYESDVYMDHCHVWEKGNRIIAREITEIILPELSHLYTW